MISIPTYNNGNWQTTEFKDRSEFAFFVLGLFKEPGLYNFDETSYMFNEQARIFNDLGFYCKSPLPTLLNSRRTMFSFSEIDFTSLEFIFHRPSSTLN